MRSPGQDHDFGHPVRHRQFPQQDFSAFGKRNEADPLALEDFGQGGRHHPALPRAPVDRHRPAARTAAAQPLGGLVENLVGGGVGGLPGPTEPSGRRGEQDDGLERVPVGRDRAGSAGRRPWSSRRTETARRSGPRSAGRPGRRPRGPRRRSGRVGSGRLRSAADSAAASWTSTDTYSTVAPASCEPARFAGLLAPARMRLYSSPTCRGVTDSADVRDDRLFDARPRLRAAQPAGLGRGGPGCGRAARASAGTPEPAGTGPRPSPPGPRPSRRPRLLAATAACRRPGTKWRRGRFRAQPGGSRRQPDLNRPGGQYFFRRQRAAVPAGHAGSTSIALQATCGHSWRAVLASPARAPGTGSWAGSSDQSRTPRPACVTVAKKAPAPRGRFGQRRGRALEPPERPQSASRRASDHRERREPARLAPRPVGGGESCQPNARLAAGRLSNCWRERRCELGRSATSQTGAARRNAPAGGRSGLRSATGRIDAADNDRSSGIAQSFRRVRQRGRRRAHSQRSRESSAGAERAGRPPVPA